MNEYLKAYGHCCNTCKYYDVMSGYCKKTQTYHYGCDYTHGEGKCDKWKIATELIEHRAKKQYKKIKLF